MTRCEMKPTIYIYWWSHVWCDHFCITRIVAHCLLLPFIHNHHRLNTEQEHKPEGWLWWPTHSAVRFMQTTKTWKLLKTGLHIRVHCQRDGCDSLPVVLMLLCGWDPVVWEWEGGGCSPLTASTTSTDLTLSPSMCQIIETPSFRRGRRRRTWCIVRV